MENGKLVAGILGCGAFGEGQNIPNCLANESVKIGGLCDIMPERMDNIEKKFSLPGIKKTKDQKELFSDPAIDIVFAATDHDTHLQQVELAALHKKHIFLEKPMAMNHLDCIKVLRLVKQSGIKLCVDYNRTFAPALLFMKDEVEKQRREKKQSPWRSKRSSHMPTLFEENATNLVLTCNDEIDSYHPVHIDAEKGGGQLIGESCHLMDMACWLIDRRPVRIFASGSSRLSHAIIIDFEDGSIATIHFSVTGTFDYPKERHELTCGGAIFINDNYAEVEIYGAGEPVRQDFPLRKDELSDRVKTKGHAGYMEKRGLAQRIFLESGKMPALDVNKGHKVIFDRFIDSILSGRPSPVDEYRGLRATYLAELACESIRSGLPVPVKQEKLEAFIL